MTHADTIMPRQHPGMCWLMVLALVQLLLGAWCCMLTEQCIHCMPWPHVLLPLVANRKLPLQGITNAGSPPPNNHLSTAPDPNTQVQLTCFSTCC